MDETEKSPTGNQAPDLNDSGRKNDSGKVRLDLLEPGFILGVGGVATFGAKKYDTDNYKKDLGLDRMYAAVLRHMQQYRKGEMLDEETGLFHPYHAAWGCMALGWYYEHRLGSDDMPRHILNDPFSARRVV